MRAHQFIAENKKMLSEGKGHLDHPEDAIFLGGAPYATDAVQAIVKTASTPQTVTIKWDGYPALIFGRGPDGKFAILDKHMFNKAGGQARKVYSPQQFMKYDQDRGADRGNLYSIIQKIWKSLAQEDGDWATTGVIFCSLSHSKHKTVYTDLKQIQTASPIRLM